MILQSQAKRVFNRICVSVYTSLSWSMFAKVSGINASDWSMIYDLLYDE